MGRTDGLTDWRTDGQGGDYMLPRNFSGSIIKVNYKIQVWSKNEIHKYLIKVIIEVFVLATIIQFKLVQTHGCKLKIV